MTATEIVNYYANLLIIQYVGKPKAFATMQALARQIIMGQWPIQNVVFPAIPASGTFTLTYGIPTAAIQWNATNLEVQAALRAIPGLEDVLVIGGIATQSLSVYFFGVNPPAYTMTVGSSTLEDSMSVPINPTVVTLADGSDDTLPIAVQNAYNIMTAVGVQLDVLAKYVGVKRSAVGFFGPITLNDADFRQLILIGILRNNLGSSLATIQAFLHQYFEDELFVFDYANMHMSYAMNSTVGSQALAQMFIVQGLLPKPMGVQLGLLIYGPDLDNFFGFVTYDSGPLNNKGFNNYDTYETDWPWLSNANVIIGV